LLWFDIHRSRPAEQRGTLAEQRDTDARAERSDAALVAQYIHELSERHGGSEEAGALEPGGEGPDD
jgi:hypothetical protein